MIEKLWFERTPVAHFLFPILYPASILYRLTSRQKRKQYLNHPSTRYRSPIPVIVVGNITVGGNGKTPVVIWLTKVLQRMGFRPGIISRGYGGRSKVFPTQVTKETPAELIGDEPKMITNRTMSPVVVAPIRSQAIKLLIDLDVNVVISDDGLQHYAMDRDIEFLVIDGKRRFGNGKFLPLGPLREPLDRLDRVDFIINNGGPTFGREIPMVLEPDLAINLLSGRRVNPCSLGSVDAFAGIGHPIRFFQTLEQMGMKVRTKVAFKDHQRYSGKILAPFLQSTRNIIMTEKDAVKCHKFASADWWYLPVNVKLKAGDRDKIISRLKEVLEDDR